MTYESRYSHVTEHSLVPYYDEDHNTWHIGKVVLLEYPFITLIPVSNNGIPKKFEDSEHALDIIEKLNPDQIIGIEMSLLLRVVFTNHLKDSFLEE